METGINQSPKGFETKLPEVLANTELNIITAESNNVSPENANKDTDPLDSTLAKGVANEGASASLPTNLPPLDTSSTKIIADSKSSSPLSASDDDLLSKEWVEAAKKILKDTEGDPHKRDDAVSELRHDYKLKRYGSNESDGMDN